MIKMAKFILLNYSKSLCCVLYHNKIFFKVLCREAGFGLQTEYMFLLSSNSTPLKCSCVCVHMYEFTRARHTNKCWKIKKILKDYIRWIDRRTLQRNKVKGAWVSGPAHQRSWRGVWRKNQWLTEWLILWWGWATGKTRAKGYRKGGNDFRTSVS